MRWRWLVNAYVEALDLPRVPVHPGPTHVWISEHAAKPVTPAFEVGVVLGDTLYVREPDGLAWAARHTL